MQELQEAQERSIVRDAATWYGDVLAEGSSFWTDAPIATSDDENAVAVPVADGTNGEPVVVKIAVTGTKKVRQQTIIATGEEIARRHAENVAGATSIAQGIVHAEGIVGTLAAMYRRFEIRACERLGLPTDDAGQGEGARYRGMLRLQASNGDAIKAKKLGGKIRQAKLDAKKKEEQEQAALAAANGETPTPTPVVVPKTRRTKVTADNLGGIVTGILAMLDTPNAQKDAVRFELTRLALALSSSGALLVAVDAPTPTGVSAPDGTPVVPPVPNAEQVADALSDARQGEQADTK